MVARDVLASPIPALSAAGEAFVHLVVSAQHVMRGVEAICQRHGITSQQYRVMRFLRGTHPGGAPRCEVRKRCLHASPDMTRLIDRLVRRRLVTRARSAADRRVSVAKLTPSGVALLDELDPLVDAAMRRAMAPLEQGEQRELARLCGTLVQ